LIASRKQVKIPFFSARSSGKADVTVSVTTASSKALPAVASDFLNQGMNFVTAPHGCMSDEPAKALALGVPPQRTILEDMSRMSLKICLGAQYDDPVTVIGFNTIERKLLDVPEDGDARLNWRPLTRASCGTAEAAN
jgi:hypothetical protein